MSDVVFRSDMSVELVNFMGTDLTVAQSAWVSTMGERSEEGDSDRVKGLINFLVRDRHGTPFESCIMQFRIAAPIFVFREHMRHRIASYNEESGRYKKLDPTFYLPNINRNLVQSGKPGAYIFSLGSLNQYVTASGQIRQASIDAYTGYENMLSNGIAREVARMVLPVNIYSTAYVTMNLRALMNFLSLRTINDEATVPSFPQREIEMVAEGYEKYFAEKFPLVYLAFCKNGRVAP